jgi:CubicO group peptidase (beta-lactamase class C family)
MVDPNTNGVAMIPTSVFNLASVGKLFTALILAHTTDLSLGSSPANYLIPPLEGACIRSTTLGGVISQSSGLPPYPSTCSPHHGVYAYADLIANLNCWGNSPPKNACPNPSSPSYIYSDEGFILLRLVLAQHLGIPFPTQLQTFAQNVGMSQTAMISALNELPALAVQGYGCYIPPDVEEGVESGCNGEPASPSVEVNYGWYQDPDGNGSQVWSSAQDMALFARSALLGDNFAADRQAAMNETKNILFTGCPPKVTNCNPQIQVGMAWQQSTVNGLRILGKNGGVPFSSTYIGLAPDKQLAVVVLVNRGQVDAAGAGQQILQFLANLEDAAK